MQAFWNTQQERGFSLVKPVMERLIGYFWTDGGPREQIIHLYRFDSYDDWVARLHGLYNVAELQPYFAAVRPLMLAQENEFLAPAPIKEVTPFWGNSNDRVVADMLLQGITLSSEIVVEQTVIQLLPGGLPVYWAAWRDHGVRAGPVATERLLGTFFSQVGPQQPDHFLALAPQPRRARYAHGGSPFERRVENPSVQDIGSDSDV